MIKNIYNIKTKSNLSLLYIEESNQQPTKDKTLVLVR